MTERTPEQRIADLKAIHGRPGMTAGEFATFLPPDLERVYWHQKVREYFDTVLPDHPEIDR